jgi:cell pole-organizing protein PopZ
VVAAAPPPAPEPEPEPEPEDVLELTQRIEPPPAVVDEIEAYEPEPARPAPAVLASASEEETLVSLPTSFAAASAFGQLSAAIAMPASGRTLEDLVRELLRPLLKEWLDQNLSGIVEAKVAEEVERIARRVR